MFESRNRLLAAAFAVALTGAGLSGCEASKDGDPYPKPITETMTASFNTATGALPYPNDLYFAPSAVVPLSDGTLNLPTTIPWRGAAMRDSLNSQDGWGTSATLDARFTLPLDAASINGTNIKIIKVWLDPSNKGPAQNPNYLPAGATSQVAGVLQYGTDFTADLSPDIDSGGQVLRIVPLKPFDYSRGPTANAGTPNAGRVLNVGYIVALTSGIKSTTGAAAQPDAEYAAYRDAANCGGFAGTGALVCTLVKAHVGIVNAVTGTSPGDVVLTLGAGTVTQVAPQVLALLEAAGDG